MSTVLITGATGRVGRHVVTGLLAAGVAVRALVRTPDRANLPADVELVVGDLYDPSAVRQASVGADAAFLLWPSFSADGAAKAAQWVRRQRAGVGSGAPGERRRPAAVSEGGAVVDPRAGHRGGRRTRAAGRAASATYWASLVDTPEPVTTTVTTLTGRPALTFADWSAEHADLFRVPSTQELADRYVAAFRAGRFDAALALTAPDLVRVAPLEGTELVGREAILDNARRLNAHLEYVGVELLGPFVRNDQFAVRFTFDERHLVTGARSTTTKLSLYTVSQGRITHEQVFYHSPPPG
ncbi:nuclear transport factor 2 family protein [Kribbella sandramycini]|uniref:NAD(P)-dependent dehydrogenase (Short-subunit alcohol dehydrogenase family) n=1 Tax=Kribbella sandramycini TaxID=60450 RepID=A0A841S0Q8_9ACTN|nr:NAD(P)H-binding protein [Kribbella sandramycini]MBB6564779.1 NAD(P)-dependent dehydrogenase (short-subunit alcohol dehydrogenase family) [Kribbella sandramycini]